jgi:hypothetical protein
MGNWEEEEEAKPKGEPGEACDLCGVKGFWLHMSKCPMCHKFVCDECRYQYGGKDFCGRHCANEFFWGGEDGEIDDL